MNAEKQAASLKDKPVACSEFSRISRLFSFYYNLRRFSPVTLAQQPSSRCRSLARFSKLSSHSRSCLWIQSNVQEYSGPATQSYPGPEDIKAEIKSVVCLTLRVAFYYSGVEKKNLHLAGSIERWKEVSGETACVHRFSTLGFSLSGVVS